ncbi:hypothetical protein CRUP_036168, partial [Coryphaenoides rupestris]
AHQLGVDLGDAVDGAGPLDAEVGGGVARGGGAEGADGAGDEQTQAVLRGDVQDVVKTCGEDTPKHQGPEETPPHVFCAIWNQQALGGHGGPDDQAVGFVERVPQVLQLLGTFSHDQRDTVFSGRASLTLAQEGAELRGVGVLEEEQQETLGELEGAGELPQDLPHAVQEEQEDGGLVARLAV